MHVEDTSNNNITYIRFSPDLRTDKIVLIGSDPMYIGKCLPISIFGVQASGKCDTIMITRE